MHDEQPARRGADHAALEWSPDLALQAEDILIVVGKPDEIRSLASLAKDHRF